MGNADSWHDKVAWKEFAPAFVLVLTSLIWYTLTYAVFSNAITELQLTPTQNNIIFGVFYAAIAISAIIGGTVMPRVRKIGLIMWMLFGAVTTMLIMTVPSNDLSLNLMFSIILGCSIGAGLPSALAFFADSVRIEKRGLSGGITWSAIGFGVLLVGVFVASIEINFSLSLIAALRIIGLVLFVLLSKGQVDSPKKNVLSYRRMFQGRELLLYLVPWVMFSLINFTQLPISTALFGDFANYVTLIEFAITGVFALIGGILADRIGRKRVVITGFILLGIEYAILSLFAHNPLSWYIFTVLDGAAWGMFATVFFMTLWGDLARENSKEKYYILGGLPYLLAGFLTIAMQPYASSIEPSMAFSLASFFLFVAVLPLIYAPETLPEKAMKDRDIKSYLEQAQRVVQKEKEKKTEKETNKSKEKTEPVQDAKEENNQDYDEARKLAEKYY
jgi:MFS family permease